MITVWFFVAIQYGGMGNGLAIAQLGPFDSERACHEVAKMWTEHDKTWRYASLCYKGVGGKP